MQLVALHCGFTTQVPFRPVEDGSPPRCWSCCNKPDKVRTTTQNTS
jgi:hypothetical protein